MVAPSDSSPIKRHEEEKSQQLEEKAVVRALFSDESSESVVSVRSEENVSNKGSPMKKTTVAYAIPSSEPFEASTDEVIKYMYDCTYIQGEIFDKLKLICLLSWHEYINS